MANDTVLWDIDRRGVATVTLNRPQVNNAYNGELIQGLHDAMDALGREAGLRVIVLRGNGKHFQAGADLAWISGVCAGGSWPPLTARHLAASSCLPQAS